MYDVVPSTNSVNAKSPSAGLRDNFKDRKALIEGLPSEVLAVLPSTRIKSGAFTEANGRARAILIVIRV